MLGRSGFETGDNEADIEPPRCGLDAGAGATLLVPGLGLITGLCETAQAGFIIECAAGADVIGGLFDGVSEECIAGQTKDEVDAVFFAPRHHLRAAVMPVAADRDVGRGPMPADPADEPTQMAAHFLTRRGLAGTQQYRYRPRYRRVIDMDRQKTALVVMGIKERQLLVTVHDIDRVIEVERHRDGRGRMARAMSRP